MDAPGANPGQAPHVRHDRPCLPPGKPRTPMPILLIAGSPSERSRSAALLDSVGQRLVARGATVERLHIRDLSPQALLLADTGHRSILAALDQVARARAIVVATPVY